MYFEKSYRELILGQTPFWVGGRKAENIPKKQRIKLRPELQVEISLGAWRGAALQEEAGPHPKTFNSWCKEERWDLKTAQLLAPTRAETVQHNLYGTGRTQRLGSHFQNLIFILGIKTICLRIA